MELRYTVIDPTKNITLLVTTPVPRDVQPRVAAELLQRERDAEQVGFAEGLAAGEPRLQMMGGEFCGNASLSAAAVIFSRAGLAEGLYCEELFEVSGAPEPVKISGSMVNRTCFEGEVAMPLPESISECSFLDGFEGYTFPLVRFPGICHAIVPVGTIERERAKAVIASWCRQLGADALGLMFFDRDKHTLTPLVYVASTDTAVWEGSCASGTAAVAAYLAELDGEYASVRLTEPRGTVSASATYSASQVRSLTMSNRAVIQGEFTALIF